MRVKSIFISDVHLGSRNCQIEPLLRFLKEYECENLFIVGDFIDAWELKRKFYWPQSYNILIQKLLRKARKGTKITLIRGNHDDFLRGYFDVKLSNIRIADEIIHVGIKRTYLILHGDQFDNLIKCATWLQKLGSAAYNILLDINLFISRFIQVNWSFAAFIKKNAKAALQYIDNFSIAVSDYCQRKGVNHVICGHIHHAEIKKIGNLTYYNCGSWQESGGTALIEDYSGEIKLIRYAKN